MRSSATAGAYLTFARGDLPGLRLRVVGVPAGKPTEGVDWLGVIPQARIAEIYGRADLLLFPTRHESFGLVVIEAMAAGLPVIVSDAIGAGIVKTSLQSLQRDFFPASDA